MLAEYLEAYREEKDLTMFHTGEGDERAVVQFASGHGEGRLIKESLRRAVCRLLIADMHNEDVEVNLRVA